MFRIFFYLLAITLIASLLAWFMDQPGSITIHFSGYELLFSPTQFLITCLMILGTIIALWSLTYKLVNTPAMISRFFKKRTQKRGLAALSSGLMAVGIGDREAAARFALQAKKTMPNEPLTQFLRAQSAQLSGDRTTARHIYDAMLAAPDTELLGLRGLFLEAEQEQEQEAALQFAEQAMRLNPSLSWPVTAVFEAQCKATNWQGALKTLEIAKTHKHMARTVAKRKRAVLLTALAQEATKSETTDQIEKALELALEAHKLAPDLIPAATIAGRLLASKGAISRASKVLTRTWKHAPHPDLARAYAFLRPGDSPKDRLQRVKSLIKLTPTSNEGPIAFALAAIEAKDWAQAREVLTPLIEKSPSARICALMARIDGEEYGDKGRVREWLAKALHAPKDPVWTADGYISKQWQPTSPITGALDCFAWKIPLEAVTPSQTGHLSRDELSSLENVTGDLLSNPNYGTEQQQEATQEIPEAKEKLIHITVEKEEKKEQTQEPEVQTYKQEAEIKEQTASNIPKAQSKPKYHPSYQSNEKRNEPVNKKEPAPQQEINIFVPPRAPDDPGLDPQDPDEQTSQVERYRKSETNS